MITTIRHVLSLCRLKREIISSFRFTTVLVHQLHGLGIESSAVEESKALFEGSSIQKSLAEQLVAVVGGLRGSLAHAFLLAFRDYPLGSFVLFNAFCALFSQRKSGVDFAKLNFGSPCDKLFITA
jgi:hypothetical protein